MVNILFVCTGDTCRSTMASAIVKHKIKQRNIKNIKCSSAGLFVNKALNINENAKNALKIMGVGVPSHISTQLTEELINKYGYVLTMTDSQKYTIINSFPYLKNVFSLKEFVGAMDIADPYGKGEASYVRLSKYLDYVTEQVLIKVLSEEDKWKLQ